MHACHPPSESDLHLNYLTIHTLDVKHRKLGVCSMCLNLITGCTVTPLCMLCMPWTN